MKYQLYPQQYAFVNDPSRFSAFIGGVGAGKTMAGAVKALYRMLRNPWMKRGMVCAPTYRLLEDATMRTCIEVWDRYVAEISWSRMRITLITGQQVLFRSAEDAEKLRGPNLWWIWLDEAALMPAKVFLICIGRLRAGGTIGSLDITTTPKGFDWIYEKIQNGEITAHNASTDTNLFTDPEFAQMLRDNYPDQFAEQEVSGQFIEIGAGIIQGGWLRRVSRADVPLTLEWVRGWDLAISLKQTADFTASVRAADYNGTLLLDKPIHMKATWPDVKRTIINVMESERDTFRVGIESVAFQAAAVQELLLEPQALRTSIEAIHPEKDKLHRALPWIGKAKNGLVAVVEDGINNWTPLLNEIRTFPQGKHDDVIDAVSISADMILNSVLVAY